MVFTNQSNDNLLIGSSRRTNGRKCCYGDAPLFAEFKQFVLREVKMAFDLITTKIKTVHPYVIIYCKCMFFFPETEIKQCRQLCYSYTAAISNQGPV